MSEFTPIASLSGGILIGIAAITTMAVFGRIAGISGILGQAIQRPRELWRPFFLIGLVISGLAFPSLAPGPIEITSNPLILITGGLLVGYGTKLGAGCTSGHGVCGISRLSPRSITATLTFMAVAAATVFIMRHLLGDIL